MKTDFLLKLHINKKIKLNKNDGLDIFATGLIAEVNKLI
jgi:hypothetical protein